MDGVNGVGNVVVVVRLGEVFVVVIVAMLVVMTLVEVAKGFVQVVKGRGGGAVAAAELVFARRNKRNGVV